MIKYWSKSYHMISSFALRFRVWFLFGFGLMMVGRVLIHPFFLRLLPPELYFLVYQWLEQSIEWRRILSPRTQSLWRFPNLSSTTNSYSPMSVGWTPPPVFPAHNRWIYNALLHSCPEGAPTKSYPLPHSSIECLHLKICLTLCLSIFEGIITYILDFMVLFSCEGP